MHLKDKAILVTGADGFLGRHVMNVLQARGYSKVCTSSVRDLTREDDVQALYCMHEPNVVINLAAHVGGIAANLAKPGEFFYDNMMIGMQMLEGARKAGVEKFVQIGSACEYPKQSRMPMLESDIWEGYPEESNAAYAMAKRALLEMGRAYAKQYGMKVLHLIPTNLYGPGDNFNLETSHVIAALIRKFEEARSSERGIIEVWGTGKATRDFLYVKDAAEGVVHMTETTDAITHVNLGSGTEYSIQEIAEKIQVLTGYEGKIIWQTDKPDGQPRRWLSTRRAELLGFQSTTRLMNGLAETIKYYREFVCEK
jgi:GDP-L-fucose synthase